MGLFLSPIFSCLIKNDYMSTYCKFYKRQKYVSYNEGQTWQALTQYRSGVLYETNSTDCGFVPTAKKFTAYYNGVAEPFELDCNQLNSLSSGETTPQGYTRSAMTQATVGQCVSSIGDDCFKNCTSL